MAGRQPTYEPGRTQRLADTDFDNAHLRENEDVSFVNERFGHVEAARQEPAQKRDEPGQETCAKNLETETHAHDDLLSDPTCARCFCNSITSQVMERVKFAC